MAQHLFSSGSISHSSIQATIYTLLHEWRIGKHRAHAVMSSLDILFDEFQDQSPNSESDEIAVAHIELARGYLSHYLSKLDESIIHYERALRIFKKKSRFHETALILSNQSENYRHKSKHTQARNLCRKAHELATQLQNIHLQTYALINEGWVMIHIPNDAALHTFENGHRLTEQWDEDDDDLTLVRCEVHCATAHILLHMADYKSALKQATLALENAELGGDMLSLGMAYRTLGNVMSMLADVPHAEFSNPEEYYRTALSAFQEIEAFGEVARTLMAHANSLAKRGRNRSAAKLLQEAINTFTQLGLHLDAARAAETQLLVTRQF